MKIAVIVNAAGGTARRLGSTALRGSLAAGFEARGIAASLDIVEPSELRGAAMRALHAAKSGACDAVAVGGGDGTIRTVAGVLADSGVPLGIIPLGTLNHFARDLGMANDLEEAIAIIAAGATRAVDVAEVNGEIFLNNSSIGLYPYLVAERERQRRRRPLPKWLAMLLGLPRALRYVPLFRLHVRVAGRDEMCRSPIVFIGNNEYSLALPDVGTRAHLDAKELAVYFAVSQSRLALLRLAWRAMLGRYDPKRDLRLLKGATAEIGARRHRLLVALDGEVEVLHTPLRYRIRPGALSVFAATREAP